MKTMFHHHRNLPVIFVSGLLLAVACLLAGCASKPPQTAMLEAQAAEQARTDAFLLSEGDVIKVTFPGAPTLNTTQKIRRDGKMVMPLIGEVTAAGMTPDALQTNLSELYASQISSRTVLVTVESSTFAVFVTGSVIHPGKIMSDHPITALDAVMEAGGFDYLTANLKDVRVIRHENGAMKKYSLNLKLVLEGKVSQPFYLKPSDIVYVPQRFTFF